MKGKKYFVRQNLKYIKRTTEVLHCPNTAYEGQVCSAIQNCTHVIAVISKYKGIMLMFLRVSIQISLFPFNLSLTRKNNRHASCTSFLK